MKLRITWRGAAALMVMAVLLAAPAAAGAQPDPRQMSGLPLPVGDLDVGTVVVRLITGSLDKPIANHPVELLGGPSPATSTSNDAGRAEFKGLRPGTRVRAVTTVAGERLESQEFAVPGTGGVRLMLVATDPGAPAGSGASAGTAPAQAGEVAIGDESRFVFEIGDEGLSVFGILRLVNRSSVPVQPAQPVVFELPETAVGAGILQGSTPQSSVAGGRVVVKGPFAPGATPVQFAYTMPYSGGDLTVSQRMPVALQQVAVLAQKIGPMQVSSSQFSAQREMSAEGQAYIVAQGPGLKQGDLLSVAFSGLPHAPTWPRALALGLAVVILATGAWAGFRRGKDVEQEGAKRRALEAKRDRLFGELTTLEEQHREGRVEAQRYSTRRRQLVTSLERVYAELDEEAVA